MYLQLKNMYPRNEQCGAPVVGERERKKTDMGFSGAPVVGEQGRKKTDMGFSGFSLDSDFEPCSYHLLTGDHPLPAQNAASWWEEEIGCTQRWLVIFHDYSFPLPPQSSGFLKKGT